ncbi:Various environmental stresses-induced protein Ves [Reichenbachiella faecimaris]|uniref:Various environmental stresses-induced protein Ves n=1 Tax=Reichenbachiella faecimaris TaxID=692418 RepID=A0A1W2G9C5_REIFA|nr:HutD family protein [Reichenbachiella faecimaris]SMD33267.1 Various environmental stresses-induced protein Ves [Reichenbachiella faecimaris]
MIIQHLKPNPSKTITWAKGTSQELFIYPPASDFQKRDFLFRISLATVEAEQSMFTPLPGIQRTLMLLEGKHTLTHEGHHTKKLLPFDQDIFQGDWQTCSRGKATNFNLMCREGAQGTLKHIGVSHSEQVVCHLVADVELIYLHTGNATCEDKRLTAGDFLMIEQQSFEQVIINCSNGCDFIQVSIFLK